MSDAWHLAQINVGRMFGVKGDPVVQGFYDALDEVNALADASPGFVWRFTGDGNDATDVQPTVDPLLLMNMSVWADAESLFDFVYRSSHTPIMSQRRNWFERFDGAYMALWWIRLMPSRSRRAFRNRIARSRRSTCNPIRGASVTPEWLHCLPLTYPREQPAPARSTRRPRPRRIRRVSIICCASAMTRWCLGNASANGADMVRCSRSTSASPTSRST
jgi:hypothetical protein